MIRAAITPGTHPHKVKSSTIKKDPQPFPITERGGKMMASNTRRKLIILSGSRSMYLLDTQQWKMLHPITKNPIKIQMGLLQLTS